MTFALSFTTRHNGGSERSPLLIVPLFSGLSGRHTCAVATRIAVQLTTKLKTIAEGTLQNDDVLAFQARILPMHVPV